ncbi:hypothetical protein BDZ91DRAFT_777386 [Kalaharituber pfeilii]|nr:hypothetical protein BDZ91DRAFT_777386 [Kalaharituber pfeilii]
MPGEGRPPPTKFPCLCRAIYSWGGENKGDLGFVEGDLIECLNAGDGQWWMGRLKRNRTVGPFPSNFVEILDDQGPVKRPVSRAGSASPMPFVSGGGAGSLTRSHSPAPPRHTRNVSPRDGGYEHGDISPTQSHYPGHRAVSPAHSYSRGERAISPVPPRNRAVSPAPSHYAQHTRAPSPAPSNYPQHPRAVSPSSYLPRSISPAPPMHYTHGYSPEIPLDYDDISHTPPPPPPHQHLTPGHSRAPSPSHHHTPSPVRHAMDDVLSSLQHMVSHDSNEYAVDRPTTPHDDPWSPHLFRAEFSPSPSRQAMRPQTSLGIGAVDYVDLDDDEDEIVQFTNEGLGYQNPRPPSVPYSERIQDRIQKFNEPWSPADDVPPAPPPKRYTSGDLTQFVAEDIIRRPQTANFMENRRSAYEIGTSRGHTRSPLSRFTTVKSSATSASNSSNAQSVVTNSTSSTGLTSISLMSGMSAGGLSATSAGSFNRRKTRAMSVVDSSGFKPSALRTRPETPSMSQSGSASGSGSGSGSMPNLLRRSLRGPPPSNLGAGSSDSDPALFGGHSEPKPKKTGFLKKLINGAKATTASAKSTFAYTAPVPAGPQVLNRSPGDGTAGIQGGFPQPVQRQSQDWVQVRRDVNRSNSLSRIEREERCRKVELSGQIVLHPVDALDENTLATMHICRPYRSDVQKLRAIFTWVSEKISWERPSAPIEPGGDVKVDVRRAMQSKRGSPEEVATVVLLMCKAGYLKAPGEIIPLDTFPKPNHFWNAVVCDGEWRMMDCSLASPTHPRRALYSGASNTTTEFHYFLTQPSKFCWTHVPVEPKQQHMVPHLPASQLLSLPLHNLQMINFDTSLLRIDGLEVVQIDFVAPVEIECIAEVEAQVFESGEVIKKRALAQTYRVKAITPGDIGHAVLKDNPHPLAFANPPYDFIPRHPTPHATKHDLYVAQPQCYQLALNNTFVFAIRQHLSSGANNSTEKPAKLALQTPSGKILRLMKKGDTLGCENGMVWETIVKVNERGAWRALVLADRSHRWCVYAEWLVS